MTKIAIVAIAVAFTIAACGSGDGSGFEQGGSGGGSSGAGTKSGSGSGSSSGSSGGSGSSSGSGGSGSSSGSGSGSSSGSSGGSGDDGGIVDDGGDYNTPTQCSSNKTWVLGDTGSAEMHPGVGCDTCHVALGSATKFPFDIAGTVYPTAHEPNDCYGVTSAQVVITDAKGTDHTLSVNAAGNFYNLNYLGIGAIPTPYTAKVVANGKTRPMISSQTDGDCNKCHSEQGTQAAPGRIMMP